MAFDERTLSFGTCEREFEKIQKALQGISEDIDEKLLIPDKHQHQNKPEEVDKTSSSSEDLNDLLNCNENRFAAKIREMKTVDLDMAIIVFEQQIEIEQEIKREDAESAKIKLDEMRERLTRCFMKKAELAHRERDSFGTDQPSSQRKAARESITEPDTNGNCQSVEDVESLHIPELKSLLFYNGIDFKENDDKEKLLALVKNQILDSGETDDWEPPGEEEMNWTSPVPKTADEVAETFRESENESKHTPPALEGSNFVETQVSKNDDILNAKPPQSLRPNSVSENNDTEHVVVKETVEASTNSSSEKRQAESPVSEVPKKVEENMLMASGKAGMSERAESIESEEEDLPHKRLEEDTVVDWDPRFLIREFYQVMQRAEAINFDKDEERKLAAKEKEKSKMDGYLDKLPVNQTKATLLKGWKKRYFKISQGKLQYFENHLSVIPLGSLTLTGSELKVPGDKLLQVRSQSTGDKIMLRCSSSNESNDWYRSIKQESAISIPLTLPVKVPLQLENPTSDIIIIDLGASTIKGGFAGEEKPRVVFPAVYAVNAERKGGRRFTESGIPDPAFCTCGFDAFDPEIRRKSKLIYPLRPTLKVDKFAVKYRYIPGFIDKVFKELRVDASHCTVIICCQRHFGNRDKEYLFDHLFGHLGVSAVYAQQQALLSLYSYRDTTGIIVDIGDHVDVFPVIEGVIIENGSASLPQGGQLITDHLSRLISEGGYRFFSEVESFIVRYVKEKSAFVSLDYQRELETFPRKLDVDVAKFELPGKQSSIKVETERFRCTEGLFDPNIFGKDHEGIHKLIERAIKQSGIDQRREMCRKIFLSGGTTLIEGFPERLQKELKFLMPETVNIQVHSSENRVNAAFAGATVISEQPTFSQLLVTKEDWHDYGSDIFNRMAQS